MRSTLFTWIDAGTFHVEMSFVFDQLSALFVLLITGVGTLIHVYSIGYMATTSAAGASSPTSTSSSPRC